MPDFISSLVTTGILFVGFISDGGYQIINSDIVVYTSAKYLDALDARPLAP